MAMELSWLEHTVHTRSVSSSNLLIATFGRHIRYEYVFFYFIGNFDEIPYEIKNPSGQDRTAAENPTK